VSLPSKRRLAVAAGSPASTELGGVGSATPGGAPDARSSSASAGTSRDTQFAAADHQYRYPAWVCLRKVAPRRVKFKLKFSRNGRFRGAWRLFHYYGRHPGPCPP
jgi:hypothetical protein